MSQRPYCKIFALIAFLFIFTHLSALSLAPTVLADNFDNAFDALDKTYEERSSQMDQTYEKNAAAMEKASD